MKNIAVLITCFNRKEKTLSALRKLHEANSKANFSINLKVYITDDGSTDGTAEAIVKSFPEINILKGTGNLYWTRGMRKSWQEALKGKYDAYLLLNDDTNVSENVFDEFQEVDDWCLSKYKQHGIYVAFTSDPDTGELSYGAKNVLSKLSYKLEDILPSNIPQLCDLGNANIMLVHNDVVDVIGILSEGYIHGKGDYDYTLKARKKKIPVLTTTKICGTCKKDSGNNFKYKNFTVKSLKERKETLYNPVGLDFKSHLTYVKRHFPLRLPAVYFGAWFKVLFPKIYLKYKKLY